MLVGISRKLTGLGVALALCASPAAAAASSSAAPAQSVSPMIALSVFGSQASVAALCGSSATAATASAAATAQGPVQGCVLPVGEVPPPVADVPPPPPAHFGISPVLLGLAGIAILAALIALGNGDDNNGNNPPVSVS